MKITIHDGKQIPIIVCIDREDCCNVDELDVHLMDYGTGVNWSAYDDDDNIVIRVNTNMCNGERLSEAIPTQIEDIAVEE